MTSHLDFVDHYITGRDLKAHFTNLKNWIKGKLSLTVNLILFLKIYLLFIYFVYFLAASGLSCGTRDLSLQCSGSSLWCTGFSLVVAYGFSLSSCGAQDPTEHVGFVVCGTRAPSLRCTSSVVVVHGLSCPAACGILVPWPGIKLASPALEGGFLTTTNREVPPNFFLIKLFLNTLPHSRMIPHTRQSSMSLINCHLYPSF